MNAARSWDAAFAPFAEKMQQAGLPEVAIRTFGLYYAQLREGEQGTLADAEIEPVGEVPAAASLRATRAAGEAALAHTVVIKLNGGLGTSMGMTRAKSLLEVKPGLTFLDVIARQLLRLRETHDCQVPLVLMNSFRTRDDSLAVLASHAGLASDLPADFVQHKVPRIRADDGTPVSWPAEPEHEWCPPGHGDLYTALLTSGLLETLLAKGYRSAFVSNADNLGAALDLDILGWFVAEGAAFAMEVKQRTAADRKGGHLARRRDGGGLVLREIAQCPEADRRSFEDISRWRLFNTNNLWIDLPALAAALAARDGLLGLPMIRNEKTVDPRDPDSPRVIQLETAMGAAVAVFPDARAILVPSHRFAPVKTTNDLLAVRSDAYRLADDQRVVPTPGSAAERGELLIDLDPAFYKTVEQFEKRFADGAPSLVDARRFAVRGDVHFGRGVVVRGEVLVEAAEGSAHEVAPGTVLDGDRAV